MQPELEVPTFLIWIVRVDLVFSPPHSTVAYARRG